MDDKGLIRMANQIAAFFAAYPEDEAVTATENHIRQFWDPRMRRRLDELVAENVGGLEAIAFHAAKRLQNKHSSG